EGARRAPGVLKLGFRADGVAAKLGIFSRGSGAFLVAAPRQALLVVREAPTAGRRRSPAKVAVAHLPPGDQACQVQLAAAGQVEVALVLPPGSSQAAAVTNGSLAVGWPGAGEGHLLVGTANLSDIVQVRIGGTAAFELSV